MPVTASVQEFLRCANVAYSVLPHTPAYTAQDEAAVTHTPGRDWAKAVVFFADGEPIQAVVPADRLVDLDRLAMLAGAGELRLASEDELTWLYPDCERGAMPPLGPLYKQRVFVDQLLAAEPGSRSMRVPTAMRSSCGTWTLRPSRSRLWEGSRCGCSYERADDSHVSRDGPEGMDCRRGPNPGGHARSALRRYQGMARRG